MESEAQKVEEFDLRQYATAEGELERTWRGRGVDWLLQNLARWTNKLDKGYALTLHTPAGVVCGTLISHKAYFEAFADEFLGAAQGEMAEQLRAMIAGYGVSDPEDEDPDADIQFIHLKDAQFFSPGQVPMPSSGVLWRGKISSVCSFHLGRFGTA